MHSKKRRVFDLQLQSGQRTVRGDAAQLPRSQQLHGVGVLCCDWRMCQLGSLSGSCDSGSMPCASVHLGRTVPQRIHVRRSVGAAAQLLRLLLLGDQRDETNFAGPCGGSVFAAVRVAVAALRASRVHGGLVRPVGWVRESGRVVQREPVEL